jgi:hypothetical protein
MGPNQGELVRGADGRFYIITGKPGAYELFVARLDHVGTFKRKWEAVEKAEDGADTH